MAHDGSDNAAYIPDENTASITEEQDAPSNLPGTGTDNEETEEPRVRENWNRISRSSNRNADPSHERDWSFVYVVARLSICFFFFCVVLVTATISALCLMFLTSHLHISAYRDLVLRDARGENSPHEKEITLETDVTWIWSLVIVICVPYGLTALGSIWKIFTTKTEQFSLTIVALAAIPETAHTVGLSLFVFYILPSFDPVAGMFLTVCVGTLPGLLQIFYPVPRSDNHRVLRSINTVLFSLHLGSLICFCFRLHTVRHSVSLTVLLPVSLLLISTSWWDNFVQKCPHVGSDGSDQLFLEKLKLDIGKRRAKTFLFLSIWKIFLTVSLTMLFFAYGSIRCLRTLIRLDNRAANCMLDGSVNLLNKNQGNSQDTMLPLVIATVSVFSSIICYKTVKYSCKILAQQLCFAAAVALSFPLTLILLGYSLTNAEMLNTWLDYAVVPNYSINNVSMLSVVRSFTTLYWLPILCFSVLYLTFGVGLHIWIPKNEKMTRTQWLFQKPLYCGVFLFPSLILNRSREDQWESKHAHDTSSRTIPKIHICATMWQEERKEMVQVVKSIFRLDKDRVDSMAVNVFKMIPYNFDAHIFFDNAFDRNNRVNKYVKRLDEAIKDAAREIEIDDLKSPSKIKTPYGGKLKWTLPNHHTLTVHLKNSALVRNKKRWSQVMFMYYFLKFGILDNKRTSVEKEEEARNTYILTLDGDVDFQPDALEALVVRMKANSDIGAVCGRIHPLGAGPMVWYQKFEYAVSHWLQKATENTLGCVLCSPGCFSLFRGSALMDVLAPYSALVTEALQKVQFDLGEDRWLCTLLLQQGHRVEYTAASDSYTFAPEGFSEFFRQRHRWVFSTMANIYALIMSWRTTVASNPDISRFYIMYLLGLFVCSVITPGTTFMLVVGALSSAFPDLSLFMSLIINLVPLLVFVFLCLKTSQQTQLVFAQILTLCYCLLMTVVLVGIIKQAAESGFCSVSTLFLTFIAGIFIISALLHPQEMLLLLYGPLYFLMVPCTLILMIIFAIANINDDSWGTRDSRKYQQNPVREVKRELKAWCCHTGDTHDNNEMEPPVNSGENQGGSGNSVNTQTALTMEEADMHLQPYIYHRQFSKKQPSDERIFWKTLIKRHLSPMDITEEQRDEEKNIMAGLKQLRNNVFLGFVVINGVFIILLFSLESIATYTPNLAFELPCRGEKYKAENVQPIAVAFTLVFGLMLLIQFIAMLLHRFSTMLQIVVSRPALLLGCCRFETETGDITDADRQRLANEYKRKNTQQEQVDTHGERRGDRRRRHLMRYLTPVVSVSHLWLAIDILAVEYCRCHDNFNLSEKVKAKFEYLSLPSRRTIEKLVEKIYKDMKDNEDLAEFNRQVEQRRTGSEIDTDALQGAIRALLEGRVRSRRNIDTIWPGHDDCFEGITIMDTTEGMERQGPGARSTK